MPCLKTCPSRILRFRHLAQVGVQSLCQKVTWLLSDDWYILHMIVLYCYIAPIYDNLYSFILIWIGFFIGKVYQVYCKNCFVMGLFGKVNETHRSSGFDLFLGRFSEKGAVLEDVGRMKPWKRRYVLWKKCQVISIKNDITIIVFLSLWQLITIIRFSCSPPKWSSRWSRWSSLLLFDFDQPVTSQPKKTWLVFLPMIFVGDKV
jgi:hypothetical protein